MRYANPKVLNNSHYGMNRQRLTAEQLQVILTVTFGNILEWFEIYSYAYLAPILSEVFFNFETDLAKLAAAFIIFGSGFLARPVGAILFGRIGDLIGRKKAFVLSITVLTIPTFLIGCLPTYSAIGIYSPLLLVLLRLLQTIPAAGETPGTGCYLYEYASPKNRRFVTSWGGVGNQIGAIIGVLEFFILHSLLSEEFLINWGWRISFWSGGLLGLFGIYLRRKLHETPAFRVLKRYEKVDKESITKVINNHKISILRGIAFSAINATTFYLISAYLPIYFIKIFGLRSANNNILSLSILILTTILLPFFGKLGDRYSNRNLLIFSALIIIFSIINLYFSINNLDTTSILIMGILIVLANTCITALLPYRFMHLFRTSVRFTGSGLSFNLSDGIIGGFTPAISLFLVHWLSNEGAFCWYILFAAIVSLISYIQIKD